MLGAIIDDIVGSSHESNNLAGHDLHPFVDDECCFTGDSILTPLRL